MIAISNTSTEKNKTGSWRVTVPKITEKCVGCSICVDYCPEGTITLVNKKAVINYDYCKGCMICLRQCPIKAIE